MNGVVSEIKGIDKNVEKNEVVIKVMRNRPGYYRPNLYAIGEIHNMDTYTLDHIYRSLYTFEILYFRRLSLCHEGGSIQIYKEICRCT